MRSLEIKTAKCSPLNLNKQSILPENIVAIFTSAKSLKTRLYRAFENA